MVGMVDPNRNQETGRRLKQGETTMLIDDLAVRISTGKRYCSGMLVASRDTDRKSTRLNSSHVSISYAVFCLKKKNRENQLRAARNLTCTRQDRAPWRRNKQ